MKVFLLIISIFLSYVSLAGSLEDELVRDEFKKIFFSNQFSNNLLDISYSKKNGRQNLEALWDIAEGNELYSRTVFNNYLNLYFDLAVPLKESLLAAILNLKLNKKQITNKLEMRLLGKLDRGTIYILLNYKNLLMPYIPYVYFHIFASNKKVVAEFYEPEKKVTLSFEELRELLEFKLDLESFKNGRYQNSVQLYMFCRHLRKYPCLMVMKDRFGDFVEVDGNYWEQPALGLARNGVPYNMRNGYTPAGIHTMDSVMPTANKQKFYGKFRRVILNFISTDFLTKKLLPPSHHSLNWWKQASVARDVGRTLLRIHGTGLINENKFSPYYPFVATSGCVSKREGPYDGREYMDQRELLDVLMDSLGLNVQYENEDKIRGLLYVIEIDDKKRAVTLEDVISNF